jgi:hypothetical protein
LSSRADTDVARLRRLRRIGHRHGLTILAAKKHEIKKGGGYMLSVEEDRRVVLGDQPSPYSATLEEIEAHLDKLEEQEA